MTKEVNQSNILKSVGNSMIDPFYESIINVISGIIGVSIGSFILYPLENIRTRLQVAIGQKNRVGEEKTPKEDNVNDIDV